MRDKAASIPYPLRRSVAATATAILPLGFKGRNWLQSWGVDLKNTVPLIATYFDSVSRRQLLGENHISGKAAEQIRAARIPDKGDFLYRATRVDFENYLVEDILVKVDRASMANSLEVRAPLLDYRIVEFAFRRVPSSLKASPHLRKVLLKELARRVLPPAFDFQRKQGFSIPLTRWLETPSWRNFFREVLLDSTATFDRRFVEGLIHAQARGRSNAERLFGLVMFELWKSEFQATL